MATHRGKEKYCDLESNETRRENMAWSEVILLNLDNTCCFELLQLRGFVGK